MFPSGVTSALEYEYSTRVEMAHGPPMAARQTPFEVDGRRLYEDATYDHIGVRLTVRLDGEGHHWPPGVAFRIGAGTTQPSCRDERHSCTAGMTCTPTRAQLPPRSPQCCDVKAGGERVPVPAVQGT